MNQYLVYALTQVSTVDDVSAQRVRFEALRHRFPSAETEEALHALLNTRAHPERSKHRAHPAEALP